VEAHCSHVCSMCAARSARSFVRGSGLRPFRPPRWPFPLLPRLGFLSPPFLLPSFMHVLEETGPSRWHWLYRNLRACSALSDQLSCGHGSGSIKIGCYDGARSHPDCCDAVVVVVDFLAQPHRWRVRRLARSLGLVSSDRIGHSWHILRHSSRF
jgi:hypothetical protein